MWRWSTLVIIPLVYLAARGAVSHFITGTTAADNIVSDIVPYFAAALSLAVLVVVPLK